VGASFRWMLAPALALAASVASADFHTYKIEQIYSNASGTVQFIVLHESLGGDSENFWAGKVLTSTHLGTTKTYTFGSNLAGAMCDYYYGCSGGGTANSRVLVATKGFADLHLITPDFVVPDGFLAVDGGTISYAGVDTVPYPSLPTDGVHAIDRNGTAIQNLATNFAGQSASVSVAAAVDLHQHGLTGSWFEEATAGQGFEIEVFPDQTAPGTGSFFVSWFTYDTVAGTAERQRWYTLAGPAVTGQPSAALTIYQNTGGNFNALPKTNPQPVGTAVLSFATCSSGQLTYTFTDGRTGTIPLTRLTQNVTCSTSSARPTNVDFARSGNWFDPLTDGQGLTIEVNPISGAVFAAWYTYAPNGAGAGAAGQRWYTAQPLPPDTFTPGLRSIPLTIYETTGLRFDTPTPPGQHSRPVGTGTLTFQSCSAATFSYTFTAGSSSGASGPINLSRVGPVPQGCTP